LTTTESPIGGGHLPKDLRETMSTRLSPASFVYLATDSKAWHETPSAKLLATMPATKSVVSKLASGRAAAVSVSIESEPVVRLSVQLADASKAADLRTWLKTQFTHAATKLGGDDTWATLETPLDKNFASLVAELKN
jgi:hypothetical protein